MKDDFDKTLENLTFEEALKLLEQTLAGLEDEKIDLEKAFDLYSKGIKLAGLCNGMIEKIESKITLLSAGDEENGEEEIEF